MAQLADSWAAQQLTEYLTRVGAAGDVCAALRTGIERAAEVFEAEAGAVVRNGAIVATIGFPPNESPSAAWAPPGSLTAAVPGLVELGARAVVTKGAAADLLLNSIRAVMEGLYWIDDRQVADLRETFCRLMPKGAPRDAPMRRRLDDSQREARRCLRNRILKPARSLRWLARPVRWAHGT